MRLTRRTVAPDSLVKSFSEIEQYIALSGRECESRAGRTGRCGCLGLYAVSIEIERIPSGHSLLVGVCRTIVMVIHIKLAGCGGKQQRAEVRGTLLRLTPVGKPGEERIGIVVRCRPPARILVVAIGVRPHYVERVTRISPLGTPAPGLVVPKLVWLPIKGFTKSTGSPAGSWGFLPPRRKARLRR